MLMNYETFMEESVLQISPAVIQFHGTFKTDINKNLSICNKSNKLIALRVNFPPEFRVLPDKEFVDPNQDVKLIVTALPLDFEMESLQFEMQIESIFVSSKSSTDVVWDATSPRDVMVNIVTIILDKTCDLETNDDNNQISTNFSDNVQCQFSIGDKKKIIASKEKFKNLQVRHGGWSNLMQLLVDDEVEIINKCDTGDYLVASKGMQWVINPCCFQEFTKGDIVRISSNVGKIVMLQSKHGGWVDSMLNLAGKRGVVKAVLPNGDVNIWIENNEHIFNARLLSLQPKINIQLLLNSFLDLILFELLCRIDPVVLRFSNKLNEISIKENTKQQLFKAINDNDLPRCKILVGIIGAEFQFPNNITPLHLAVFKGNQKIITLLIEYGANVNAMYDDGKTPLLIAVERKDSDSMRLLMFCGADPNIQNMKNENPILLATRTSQLDLLKLIMDNFPANLSLKDFCGETPLHLAIANNYCKTVHYLLDKNADINITNENNLNCWFYAIRHGNKNIAKLILKKDATLINTQKSDGCTALHLAAMNNHTECILLLLDKYHADMTIVNHREQTPLHLAVIHRHLQSVKLLIDKGANVNALDISSNTPLHFALKFHSQYFVKSIDCVERSKDNCEDFKKIARHLVYNGAHLDIKDKTNKTCLDFCIDKTLLSNIINIRKGTDPEFMSMTMSISITPSIKSIQNSEIINLYKKIESLEDEKICTICRDFFIDTVFQCGHKSCKKCSFNLHECHLCREIISDRILMYNN